jgi:hypothetical protein
MSDVLLAAVVFVLMSMVLQSVSQEGQRDGRI